MKKSFLVITAAALMVAACKNGKFAGYETSKNGLMYKIIKHGSGKKANINDMVLFSNVSMTMKDSQLAPPVANATLKVTKPSKKGDPNELFTFVNEGDSVAFLIAIDSIVSKGAPLPKPFKHGEYFKVGISVKKIMNEQDYKAFTQHVQDSVKEARNHDIIQYVSTNKLDARHTDDGLYYTIDKPGSGPMVEEGKKVKVKYKGYLTNGSVFDPGAQPIDVEIGKHQVIPGWEEGLKMYRKGGSGKLIIPSALAYGDRGAGASIPPNSNLVFDIEILDVANAAPDHTMNNGPKSIGK